MTCKEFQEILPEIMDGGQTIEQEMHWKSCHECSGSGSRSYFDLATSHDAAVG